MALANICDRCGTVYKAHEDIRDFRYHVFDNEISPPPMYDYNTYHGRRVGEMLDLCLKCCAELYTWVNTEIKHNE